MAYRWTASVLAAAALAVMACPADATFPGRNGRLAAVVGPPGSPASRLVTTRPDGSHQRLLQVVNSSSVQWSPDGRSLVLDVPCRRRGCNGNEGGPAGPGVLLIIDAATGTVQRIRTSMSLDFQEPQTPSWTPNGRLLWIRSIPVEGGDAVVIVADRHGRRQRVVPMQDQMFAGVARAAPVAGLIAVSVWSPVSQIRVLPAGGGAQRVLADCVNVIGPPEPLPPCKAPHRLDWSPDGTRIAFDAESSLSPGPMIRVADVATGAVQEVRAGTSPFWSPDGRLLGSLSVDRRIQIGPPAPGMITTLPLRAVRSADWQPRP
jgi:hypothetical protein